LVTGSGKINIVRIGITYKIAFIFIFTIALVFTGIFFYLNSILSNYTYHRIKDNLVKGLNLSASLLESSKSIAYNSYLMDQEADVIGNDLHLRATIIGLDGTVYGDSSLQGQALYDVENHLDRIEVQSALKGKIGESERFSATLKTDKLYVAKIFGKDRPQGIIRLAVPLSDIKALSDKLKGILTISLILAFIFSIVLFFIISAWISRPLREISWVAKNIAHGDFSKRPLISSKDEVGELAESIRFMSDQIKAKIVEVTTNKLRLEAVLWSMFEGVMVLEVSGKIILINQALRELLNISEDPAGKSAIEVIRNADIQDIAETVLKGHPGVLSREVSILAPIEKNLIVHATPVLREGKHETTVLVFHDITELRRLENIRKDFVANVSHELRTPVSNIQGYSETLLQGALNDHKNAKEFVEIIFSDSQRLAALISDLLDLSQIESGKFSLDIDKNMLNDMVDSVYKKIANKIKVKKIEFIKDIDEDANIVYCDKYTIEQALLNLIENAVKYTPEAGTIKARAEKENGFVRVDISDTGIGISQEHMPRLFERFYRIDKARSREQGGTGLGLAIVKHIIQAHNGKVWVESIPPKGSTFSFTLPQK
jgi:two-component system, OmpR family, phosphate regulon sensor histidine kinase PhoR